MTFYVFANDELIGTTQLGGGDPPMGIVFDVMTPNEAYQKYRNLFICQDYCAIEKLNLFVTTDIGERLAPCSGIGIVDYSEEAEENMIQVNIFGLDTGVYRKYFSHHIQKYEEEFSE